MSRANEDAPLIVLVVGVRVAVPAPRFCTLVMKPAGNPAPVAIGTVTATGEALEIVTSFDLSVAAMVYVVPDWALIDTKSWATLNHALPAPMPVPLPESTYNSLVSVVHARTPICPVDANAERLANVPLYTATFTLRAHVLPNFLERSNI